MSKNKWFKHYNAASSGDTIQQFLSNRDYESVTLFWILLEILSRTESESNRGETQVELKFLSRVINMKPTKLLKLLSRFAQIACEWKISVTEEKIKFLVPNWLELQETMGGKRESKKQQNLTEVRSKKIDKRKNNKKDLKIETEIEKIYELYPRKIGKSTGIKKLLREIQDEESLSALHSSVINYTNYVKENETEEKFIKHFSSFVSEWKDWIKKPSLEAKSQIIIQTIQGDLNT